jgi:hypothetical protein
LARIVALRVLLVLGGLAALYVLLANVLIKSALLKRLANSSPSVQLDYASAYTILPGRVHVEGLRLRSEDYNVQFEVGIESAVVDVSLLELSSKKFHALRVRAEGVSFRARHKVHAVGPDARRLAAYPPIAGFSDPPLYVGKKPPPIPDSEYDLWEIALDDVEGDIEELWILEHRFQGKAKVKGGFAMRPARFFAVLPSRLELLSGTLSIGGVPSARDVKGALECDWELTDVQRIAGAQVLRTMSANLVLTGARGDLAAANVYTEPRLGVSAGGGLSVQARVRVRRGVIEQGSSIELKSDELVLRRDRERLRGAARVVLESPSPNTLSACASSRSVALERPGAKPEVAGPKLGGATLCAALTPADIGAPIGVRRVTGSVEKLEVPKLEWWSEALTRAGSRLRLSGAADTELSFTATPSGELTLKSRTDLRAAFVSDGELGVLSTGKVELSLESNPKTPRSSSGSLAIDVPHVKFAREREISDELGLRLRSRDLTFENVPGERRLFGEVTLEARNVRALLDLVVGPAAVAGSLLGVRDLSAPARFAVTAEGSRVEVPRAKSGSLEVSGYLSAPREGSTAGAFLFETPIANFGLSLRGSKTEFSPLVSDEWLPKNWARLPASPRR